MIIYCLQCKKPYSLILHKLGNQTLCSDCLTKEKKEEEDGADL